MTITIKLDRPAVLDLIDKDPEFKFELSNAVVSEVIRKVFEKDMARLLKEVDPELFQKAAQALNDHAELEERIRRAMTSLVAQPLPSYHSLPPMTERTRKVFDKAIKDAEQTLENYIPVVLNRYVTAKAQARVDELLADRSIDDRIAARVDRLIDEELERRVKAHNEALLAKLKGVLG